MRTFFNFIMKGFWIFLLPISAFGTNPDDRYSIREDLTPQKMVEEMGLGINLGNTMESCGSWINPGKISNYETAWGSPLVTEAMIAGLAKAGFSSLRIPVAWSNMMKSDYTIEPTLLARVKTIIDWTIDNGMVAMINEHWDNGWMADFSKPALYDERMKKFVSIWTQISNYFSAYGDRLIFESMNEVGFDDLWTPWSGTAASKAKAFGIVNTLNQTFVDVVRASGGNNAKRFLVSEVYNTGLEYAYDPLFKMPNDPANRSIATVHYYTPACFAIAEGPTSWCPNGQAIPTWGTDADWNELNTNMNNLKKNCVDKGIPIIIGEYAACGGNKTQEMVRLYAVSVTEAVYSRGMCPMLWDTPGGQYDRSKTTFTDPLFLEQFQSIMAKYGTPTVIKKVNISNTEPVIFPNPSKGIVTIRFMQEPLNRWELLDAQMRLLDKQQISGHSAQVDVSALPKGTYFFRVTTDSKSYVQQVIVL